MQPAESNFFYTDLFVAIITLIVGTFGFYLYHLRQRDGKRRVAKIILLEIENAQDKLREAKTQILARPDDPLPENLYAMPTDSWSANKHLFVEDFKPPEWNAINQFYDYCQLYDEAIRHNDSRFAQQELEVRRNVHRATYKYAKKCGEALLGAKTDEEKAAIFDEFVRKRDSVVGVLTDGKYIHVYTPSKQNLIAKHCLDNVDTNLSLNTVGLKLTKLGKHKRKHF